MNTVASVLLSLSLVVGFAIVGFLVAASVIVLANKWGARADSVIGLVMLTGLGLFAGANNHYLPAWAGLLGAILLSPLFCFIAAVGLWLPAKAAWHALATLRANWRRSVRAPWRSSTPAAVDCRPPGRSN